MSPLGNTLRNVMRTYPALINCTTIDWYLDWTQQAYIETAKFKILTHELTSDQSYMQNGDLVNIMINIHHHFLKMSDILFQEQRRKVYITPIYFLTFLQYFNQLVIKFENHVNEQIRKYSSGIQKISETGKEISKMKEDLFGLQQKLDISKKENLKLLENLSVQSEEAATKKKLCQEDEIMCQQQKLEADKLQNECQSELDRVLPLLSEAQDALSKVTKDDLTLLRSYQNPSNSVKLVMEAMCYVLGVDQNIKWKPVEVGAIQKYQDFWEYSKKFLLNDKLIKVVKNVKEDKIREIRPESIEKLNKLLKDPLFEKEKVFGSSEAAGNFSMWIRAVFETYQALQVVNPKREQLKEAKKSYLNAEEQLKIKQNALQEALAFVEKLTFEYNQAKKTKEDLEENVQICTIRLERATRIIDGLNSEKIAWEVKENNCQKDKKTVLADAIFSAAALTYFGTFPMGMREQGRQFILNQINSKFIVCNNNISLQNKLANQLTVSKWCGQQKLPNDSFSIDNASLVVGQHMDQRNGKKKQFTNHSKQCPEFPGVDDETRNKNLKLFIKIAAMTVGNPILVENLQESISPICLEPLVFQQYLSENSKRIQFGDKIIDINQNFRLYLTSKLVNPVYSPEISSKVCILNFIVTEEGLMDQMLNILVKVEDPEKESQRIQNIKALYDNQMGMEKSEQQILSLITQSQSESLLDDEKLIQALQTSQQDTLNCQKKIEELCENINKQFMRNLFENVSISLEEKDKILISFMICTKILKIRNEITQQELRFLTVGAMENETILQNPKKTFLNEKQWNDFVAFTKILPQNTGQDFLEHFVSNVDQYSEIFMDTQLMKLIQILVEKTLGKEFIQAHPYELQQIYEISENNMPIIIILSSGIDPQESIVKLAQNLGKNNSLQILSLGQGQNEKAENIVLQSLKSGSWVLLQNCHLSLSFMPILENIFETKKANQMHKSFRLWLTTQSHPKFSVSLLQKGLKLRSEPPHGIRNLMIQAYNNVRNEREFLEMDEKQPFIWQRALFSLIFFHSLIQERKRFGPMGWNQIYEFSQADLIISLKQMAMLIDKQGEQQKEISEETFENLLYLVGKIFGMYKNAEIVGNIYRSDQILNQIMQLLPKNASSQQSEVKVSYEQQIQRIIYKLKENLMEPFDIEQAQRKIQSNNYLEQSVQSFIYQDIIRYNKLLKIINNSFQIIQEAIEGTKAMDDNIEQIMEAIYDFKLPQIFKKYAYPSNKQLGSWFDDLKQKLKHVKDWIENGKPKIFWIGQFFYTQSFLTAILQQYSRKAQIPIDNLSYSFKVVNIYSKIKYKVGKQHPENGAYIYGFYIEGANWDLKCNKLTDPKPGQIYQQLPLIHFIPGDYRWNILKNILPNLVKLPVYKTSKRAEEVQSTGINQNWLIDMTLPYKKEQHVCPDTWSIRGIAILTQLDH
ncbi:hypothetical protein PPERSA_07601 [Pseudocohnilembus persalinus]|uniref:P-loop containing nucleoside triphosphate hydrolase n=1 Tax=Pseudocohnilembus persalinus TaxID=266149 RepID=A0A0V0QIB3_PSEPJ|nr:hypothetical protein PPERSA_07601 [Pseudocohnilembus persalinus]|eukprot:KRX01956.1 hypothetical protein PPERSA_07601 [Pseudocohnilembus persalinus]